MCTGLEIAAIAALAGGATAAAGQVQQGIAAKKAGEYNAAVAENQALTAINKATFDANRQELEAQARLSLMQTRFNKSGVDLKGTPLLVLTEQSAQDELDHNAIIYGGGITASGFREQGALAKFEGQQKFTGSVAGAGSTLLTTGGETYMGYKKAGG